MNAKLRGLRADMAEFNSNSEKVNRFFYRKQILAIAKEWLG